MLCGKAHLKRTGEIGTKNGSVKFRDEKEKIEIHIVGP